MVARASSRGEAHSPKVTSGNYIIKIYRTRLVSKVTGSNEAVTQTSRYRDVVRPREIPKVVWDHIRRISWELRLTIPDTLDLLADIYQDVREGKLVDVEKCVMVVSDD